MRLGEGTGAGGTSAGEAPALEAHPWNTGFTWPDHHGPFRILAPEQAAAFDEDGYFLFEGAFDAGTVASILSEIDDEERRMERFLESQPSGRVSIAERGAITFTTHLVRQSERLRSLAASTPLAHIASDLCGPDVRLYWDQAVYKKPEKPRRFPWHQDNGYAFVEPQQYLTCWIALTAVTERNGCPVVAPGPHRRGTLRHRYVDPLGFECMDGHPAARAVEAGAGDIVVFSSLTPHLTGPNLTDRARKAWIVQYCPDGAAVLEGDPARGRPERRVPCASEDRQFPVVHGGELVEPPPIPPRQAWT